MPHRIYKVEAFQIVGPYTLRLKFDDQSEQVVDFKPVLAGQMYGPLRELFALQPGQHRCGGANIGMAKRGRF